MSIFHKTPGFYHKIWFQTKSCKDKNITCTYYDCMIQYFSKNIIWFLRTNHSNKRLHPAIQVFIRL